MNTDNTKKTSDLRYSITVFSKNEKEKTIIKICLNDECRNGHEDFSITADVYEKNGRGYGLMWRDYMRGCCHNHILSLRPELAPFVALHLSTWQGVPMHSASNAWYWFQGMQPEAADSKYHAETGSSPKTPDECRAIFADHIRATPEQVQQIEAMLPRSQVELQVIMEDMGFFEQWQREAQAAIRQLEEWTGQKFESKATRGFWEPIAPEMRQLIAERRASGYYSPDQVAKRDEEKRQAARAARIQQIRDDHAAKCKDREQDFRLDLWFAENYDIKPNVIWYRHTNELAANWTTTEKLMTREEFDALTAKISGDLFDAPPKFSFKDKPRY
jgi:hypothetical protein